MKISVCLSNGYSGITRFFTTPIMDSHLAFLRVSVSLVMILQVILLRDDLLELYSRAGWIQGELNDYLLGPYMPRLSWFTNAFEAFGMSESASIYAIFSLYSFFASLLALGFMPRFIAFLTYLLHFAISYSTGSLSSYGVDTFIHIILFYLILFPTSQSWSLFPSKREKPIMTAWNCVGLRLLQLHLCVVYLVAGWAKAWGSQWWNGEAIWRALMMPEFSQFDVSLLVYVPFLPLIAAWATLFFEMGYPVFIAIPRIRNYCLGAILGMHLGIFFAMGLHTFALMMILWNMAVFTDLPKYMRWNQFRLPVLRKSAVNS